jgi:hypothetical protein
MRMTHTDASDTSSGLDWLVGSIQNIVSFGSNANQEESGSNKADSANWLAVQVPSLQQADWWGKSVPGFSGEKGANIDPKMVETAFAEEGEDGGSVTHTPQRNLAQDYDSNEEEGQEYDEYDEEYEEDDNYTEEVGKNIGIG